MKEKEKEKEKKPIANPVTRIILIIEMNDENKKKDLTIEQIKIIVNAYSRYFVMIEHDRDIKEDGGKRSSHTHILTHLRIRHRPLGLAAKWAKDLNINIDRISARAMRNEELATQYLIHMNNPEKPQYLITELITNNEERLIEALTDSKNEIELTANKLINIVEKTPHRIAILKKIGLKNYNKFFKVIEMCLDEYYIRRSTQAREKISLLYNDKKID